MNFKRKKMKKLKAFKIKLLQKFANFIVKQVENSATKRQMDFWLDFGMGLDGYCVNKGIYLN